MTKHIRIENADNSDHKVKVFVEEKNAAGEWVRIDGVKPVELNYPTTLTEMMIHSTRRLVVEEA